MTTRIGLARRDITPPPGLPMDGYDARQAPAQGVLDPLGARVLHVADGDLETCLVSLDVLGVSKEITTRLQHTIEATTGVPRDAILITATHTHAGPIGIANPERDHAAVDGFVDDLIAQVIDAAREAQHTARPCSIGYTEQATNAIASNRIDPDRPTDPLVRVLRFSDQRDDTLHGLVLHYACHPTVLAEHNLAYSGDFAGRALHQLEDALEVPCLFLQRAAADVSTRFTRRARTVAEADRFATALADAARTALASPGRARRADLAITHRSVQLPRRSPPTRQALQALVRTTTEELERALSHGGGTDSAELDGGRVRRLQVRRASAQQLLRTSATHQVAEPVTTTLTAVHLAGTIFVTIPGELFQATARTIDGYGKDWLPITLANAYLGYYPTTESITNAEYESLNTTFDDTSTHALQRTIGHLVDELRHRKSGGEELP